MKYLIPLAFLLGCGGSTRPDLRQAPADYEEALSAWTRRAEAHEGLESRLFVRSTWLSPAFAAAYAARRIERPGLTGAEAEQEKQAITAAAEREIKLFVAVVTNDPYWNDLEQGEEATLKVRLLSGGEPTRPARIEQVSDDMLADMKPFFPYADALSRAYWVVFPAPAEGFDRGIHVRIAGAPAIIDLQWEVR